MPRTSQSWFFWMHYQLFLLFKKRKKSKRNRVFSKLILIALVIFRNCMSTSAYRSSFFCLGHVYFYCSKYPHHLYHSSNPEIQFYRRQAWRRPMDKNTFLGYLREGRSLAFCGYGGRNRELCGRVDKSRWEKAIYTSEGDRKDHCRQA